MNTSQHRMKSDEKKPPVATAAVVITAAVVFAALLIGRSDRSDKETTVSQQNETDGPQQCVKRMLFATQEGDVATYLACFADDLQETLQEQIAKKTSAQFATELQRREADLKNFVTKDVLFPSENEAVLELERIYTDRNYRNHRNSRHRVRLKRIGEEWKITELIPVEQYQPEIPFGTPVVPGLEGPPEK